MLLFKLKLRQAQQQADNTPQRQELRAQVARMIVLLREAMSGDVPEELGRLIRLLADNSAQIEKAVVAWVLLIEVLVQEAQRAQRRGSGQRKKSQVKAAIFQLLNSPNARLPGIPAYLYPLVIDFAIDWAIDAIVEAEKEYSLWDPGPEDNTRTPFGDLFTFLKNLIRGIWEKLAGAIITCYTNFKYREPLGPELQAAVNGVEVAGFISDKNSAIRLFVNLIEFIGNNGPQVIALTQLVFEAVHMAESFINLDGPGKKQYAKDLIIATLEDLGFPAGSGLFGLLISVFVDAGIEAAVSVFNKRAPETFKHRSSSTAAVPAPVPRFVM